MPVNIILVPNSVYLITLILPLDEFLEIGRILPMVVSIINLPIVMHLTEELGKLAQKLL